MTDALADVEIGSIARDVPVVRPKREVGLAAFVSAARGVLDDRLLAHGAILFRGWDVTSPEAFRSVVDAMKAQPLKYVYRSTPRTELTGGIYTATEYPPRATIPLHCENAYAREWPLKLYFCCAVPAAEGGETPLARVADVTARIPDTIKSRFADNGVLYVRNYGSGFDLPWETVFQTRDRTEVERFCAARGIGCEWTERGLRTKQRCQAMATHPRTGERLWFNQAHLFHPSALDEATRDALETLFEPEDFPRNAFYGDGREIELEALDAVRAAFDAAAFAFPWERGDVLFVDNMLAAHGRRPFQGARRVIVAMSDAYSPREPPAPP